MVAESTPCSFIMNAWYVAARRCELGADRILARTICGEAIAFFVDSAGEIRALADRCCHREMPLTRGFLERGTIRCGYHGLRFDGSGKCVEIPGQTSIPPRARGSDRILLLCGMGGCGCGQETFPKPTIAQFRTSSKEWNIAIGR